MISCERRHCGYCIYGNCQLEDDPIKLSKCSSRLEKTIKESLIEEYHCYDHYGETCDEDCEQCKADLQKDLDAFEQEVRLKAIDDCLDVLVAKLPKIIVRLFIRGEIEKLRGQQE